MRQLDPERKGQRADHGGHGHSRCWLAFGILTIDIGRMLVTKTQLQNAADAGALAGASVFCENFTATDAEVQSVVRIVGGNHRALAMDGADKVDN